MERNFYNDDFEHLIKQKADQYKMYPSERVWKGVYGSLYSRKRWDWVGLGFVLLLSGVSYYAIEELLSPSPAAVITKAEQPLAQETKKDENKLNVPFFPSTFKSGTKTNSLSESVATETNNESETIELANLIVEEADARQPQAKLWETLRENQEL